MAPPFARFNRLRGTGEGKPEGRATEDERKGKKKRGRPKKGEDRPTPGPTRIERQVDLPARQALAELPTACDFGVKHDTNGNTTLTVIGILGGATKRIWLGRMG